MRGRFCPIHEQVSTTCAHSTPHERAPQLDDIGDASERNWVRLHVLYSCSGFIAAQMPTQVAMFATILSECQATVNGAGGDLTLETCTTGECAARHVNLIEQRLTSMPVPWWQGDGSLYIGNQQTSLQFAPCRPVYLYDAGVTQNPKDCLVRFHRILPQFSIVSRPILVCFDAQNGLPGTSEIELEPDHDYPLTPMFGCPPNPNSPPGGGWSETAPTADVHYFSNVLSGDIGGYCELQ